MEGKKGMTAERQKGTTGRQERKKDRKQGLDLELGQLGKERRIKRTTTNKRKDTKTKIKNKARKHTKESSEERRGRTKQT